ncbi:phage integrase N-terminal SAM-like domain-containing protein [Bradyrhizobium sp. 186]|nr:phage integrase N-terminal SAM-like domain-containing protein [Bradyrhizobium sp. 186]UPK39910.1 phage integrase N-terminal SAM-like domain-containing protein [Bradyrhizobium sp. 186]
MSTVTVSPLRQRMIEDMNARKLCAGTQRGHIHSCKRFARFLKQSPDTATAEDIRRFQLHLCRDGREHLQSQPHHDRVAVLVSRDVAATGSCGRDLSPP